MSMQKREPYVRKHVHRWKITARKKAQAEYWNYFGGHHDAEPGELKRECEDCCVKQTALVPDESVLIPGYEAISSDVEWKDITK